MPEKPTTADGYASEYVALVRGPRRVAQFLTGGPDDSIQADVVGYVDALLREVDR